MAERVEEDDLVDPWLHDQITEAIKRRFDVAGFRGEEKRGRWDFERVSRALGVTRPTLNRLINDRSASSETLRTVCDKLAISAVVMVARTDDEADLFRRIQRVRDLSDRDFAAISSMTDSLLMTAEKAETTLRQAADRAEDLAGKKKR